MKPVFAALLVLTWIGAQTPSVTKRTWTGQISDSICGLSHKAMQGELTDRECTLLCVQHGSKYVIATVLPIANQDFTGLQEQAGHTVELTGEQTSEGIIVFRTERTQPTHAPRS